MISFFDPNTRFTEAALLKRLQELGQIKELDIWLEVDKRIDLSELFAKQMTLERLSLRCPLQLKEHGIFPLPISSLTALHLENVRLLGELVRSIQGLPLQRPSPCTSTFAAQCRLHELAECKTLREADFTDVGPQIVQGGSFHLAERLPEAKVVPQPLIVDYRNYAGMFSREKTSEFSFSLEEIRTQKHWPNFDDLLAKGKTEHTLWESLIEEFGNYVHNTSGLTNACYLNFPDGRKRLAARHPFSQEEKDEFIRALVARNVTVVVMLNSDPPYLNHPDVQVLKIFQNNIYTRTDLKIGEHTLVHLQIDWPGRSGIEIERLYPFMQEVKAAEKAMDGQTLIHCHLGIGRTGAFCASMIGEQALEKLDPKEPLYFNIQVPFLGMRQQRPAMIEVTAQFDTVLNYLQWLLTDPK
jgi:hypothetical protein